MNMIGFQQTYVSYHKVGYNWFGVDRYGNETRVVDDHDFTDPQLPCLQPCPVCQANDPHSEALHEEELWNI